MLDSYRVYLLKMDVFCMCNTAIILIQGLLLTFHLLDFHTNLPRFYNMLKQILITLNQKEYMQLHRVLGMLYVLFASVYFDTLCF